MKNQNEKIENQEIELSEIQSLHLSNLARMPKSSKNENSKQKFYRLYCAKIAKNEEFSKDEISKIAAKLEIKEASVRAWTSRFNKAKKMPKMQYLAIESEESAS